jgi:hypothetical protein
MENPLQDAIHAGIPSGSSVFDRMANTMSLPYFCLHKLVWATVTSVTGSSCCTHGHKLVLGADAVVPMEITFIDNGGKHNLNYVNL